MSEILIKLKNISVCQENKTILESVNFEAGIGEFIYIIGKVGSGKSSLVKTMYADLPFKDGEANVVGISLQKIKHKEVTALRRKIGMVFQDLQLLTDRNVYENLKFVLRATGWKNKSDMDIRIEQVLRSVGMLDKINSMPSKLSGGEQQCVCIARATLNNPPLIFADEPTGNLDPESAYEVMKILHKLKDEGKTVIMVTHNYNLLKKFPGKTYICENGKFYEMHEEEIMLEE